MLGCLAAVGQVALCLLVSNQCPTVSLSADRTTARTGETVTFVATVTDVAEGSGPITYEWDSSQGVLARTSDNEVTLNTTGLVGTVEVSVTIGDGDPSCTQTGRVTVSLEPICLAAILVCTPCGFMRNKAHLDDACGNALDDVMVRMTADPTTSLVLDGHSDRGERRVVGLRRAEAVRDYLVNEKGIDTTRIVIRSFDDECSKSPSVEIFLVPQGRSGDEIEKDCN